MSKRIISINTPGTYLCEKDRQLEIWLNQERLGKIPIEDLGILMIENTAVTITGKLLSTLSDAGAVVSICDSFHLPNSILLPLNGVALHASRTRALASLSKPTKKRIWQKIVSKKIEFQSQVVASYQRESGLLRRLSKEVDSGDSKNREAMAAKVYWGVLFSELDPTFKRSGDSPINGYLNYAYAIVRSAIARELVGSGFTPVFGVFHESRDNAFALADDLLEVYRPFVDLFIKGKIEVSMNTDLGNFKREMISILTTNILMDSESVPFLSSITRLVDSFVRIVEGAGKGLSFPDLCEFQAID